MLARASGCIRVVSYSAIDYGEEKITASSSSREKSSYGAALRYTMKNASRLEISLDSTSIGESRKTKKKGPPDIKRRIDSGKRGGDEINCVLNR